MLLSCRNIYGSNVYDHVIYLKSPINRSAFLFSNCIMITIAVFDLPNEALLSFYFEFINKSPFSRHPPMLAYNFSYKLILSINRQLFPQSIIDDIAKYEIKLCEFCKFAGFPPYNYV